MRKLLILVAVLLAVSAYAAVTADIKMAVVDGKVWAEVRLHGIEKAETFKIRYEWTAPEVYYVHKDGAKTKLFADTSYTPEKPCGDPRFTCFCADTNEKGCWRSRAFRTVETRLSNGKAVRAEGVWKVKVVRVDTNAVLGEAEYAVE